MCTKQQLDGVYSGWGSVFIPVFGMLVWILLALTTSTLNPLIYTWRLLVCDARMAATAASLKKCLLLLDVAIALMWGWCVTIACTLSKLVEQLKLHDQDSTVHFSVKRILYPLLVMCVCTVACSLCAGKLQTFMESVRQQSLVDAAVNNSIVSDDHTAESDKVSAHFNDLLTKFLRI
jgi:hypothetical protein